MVDLTMARQTALDIAREWDVTLGPPFEFANVSYVAPAGLDAVLKVSWEGDDESLHEADALELWNGDGAVRLLQRSGRAILEERAVPGNDVSALDDAEATGIAVAIADRLWRPARSPFRSVLPAMSGWLDEAERRGAALAPLARELFQSISREGEWLVHGDLHHHNILRAERGYIAIDPKPYIADREYDVASFLWNPFGNDMANREQTERRIEAFVDAGLDEYRIRAWAVIRGAYLRPDPQYVEPLRALVV